MHNVQPSPRLLSVLSHVIYMDCECIVMAAPACNAATCNLIVSLRSWYLLKACRAVIGYPQLQGSVPAQCLEYMSAQAGHLEEGGRDVWVPAESHSAEEAAGRRLERRALIEGALTQRAVPAQCALALLKGHWAARYPHHPPLHAWCTGSLPFHKPACCAMLPFVWHTKCTSHTLDMKYAVVHTSYHAIWISIA